MTAGIIYFYNICRIIKKRTTTTWRRTIISPSYNPIIIMIWWYDIQYYTFIGELLVLNKYISLLYKRNFTYILVWYSKMKILLSYLYLYFWLVLGGAGCPESWDSLEIIAVKEDKKLLLLHYITTLNTTTTTTTTTYRVHNHIILSRQSYIKNQ